MSIQNQIIRIQTARNAIRDTLVNFGLVENTSNIEDCATAITNIENQGSVSATVTEGETYTIPRGYHNGSGTVSGIKGGGNYTLQSKVATPTKSQQSITPDSGYYGLSDVTVKAIPENYQDVSSVTATAEDVLANKIIVTSDGKVTAGIMINNGAVTKNINAGESYIIPKGYHDGTGKVTGNSLASQTSATAIASDILLSKTAWVNGSKLTGTMANNGTINKTIIGLTETQSSVTIPKGYTAGGTVSLSTDIEDALSMI